MDLDVTRIAETHLQLIIDVMNKTQSLEELKELYEEAQDALEGVYNSLKSRIE